MNTHCPGCLETRLWLFSGHNWKQYSSLKFICPQSASSLIGHGITLIGFDCVQTWEISVTTVVESINSSFSVMCRGSYWTHLCMLTVDNDESGAVTAALSSHSTATLSRPLPFWLWYLQLFTDFSQYRLIAASFWPKCRMIVRFV